MKRIMALIGIMIFGFVSITFISYLRPILYGISILLGFIVIYKKEKKKNTNIDIIIVILFALYIIVSYCSYSFLKNYGEVTKKLQKMETPFSIVGIEKKTYDQNDKYHCKYIFDIKMREQKSIVFQTGYCECGSIMTAYCNVDNYLNKTIMNYYEQYKEKHPSISLTIDAKEAKSLFGEEPVITIESDDNREDACQFIHYLKENVNKEFVLTLYTKNRDFEERIASWVEEKQYNCSIQ